MNELLAKLAEQAAEYAVLNPSDEVLQSETEDAKVEIPAEFISRLAELIVAECTVIMYEDTTPNVPYVNAFDVANKIKEHFGVEE